MPNRKKEEMRPIDKNEHRARHVELHRALDELVADFMQQTGKLASATTVMELMSWSARATR